MSGLLSPFRRSRLPVPPQQEDAPALCHRAANLDGDDAGPVFLGKYRKRIFVGEIEKDVKKYLLETLKSLEMTPIAMEIMPDHIHLLVDCKPQLKLSDAIKVLKGNTARWLFLKHPEIKKQLWGGHLWNPSYFVATVSDRTLDQVKRYIDDQKTR